MFGFAQALGDFVAAGFKRKSPGGASSARAQHEDASPAKRSRQAPAQQQQQRRMQHSSGAARRDGDATAAAAAAAGNHRRLLEEAAATPLPPEPQQQQQQQQQRQLLQQTLEADERKFQQVLHTLDPLLPQPVVSATPAPAAAAAPVAMQESPAAPQGFSLALQSAQDRLHSMRFTPGRTPGIGGPSPAGAPPAWGQQRRSMFGVSSGGGAGAGGGRGAAAGRQQQPRSYAVSPFGRPVAPAAAGQQQQQQQQQPAGPFGRRAQPGAHHRPPPPPQQQQQQQQAGGQAISKRLSFDSGWRQGGGAASSPAPTPLAGRPSRGTLPQQPHAAAAGAGSSGGFAFGLPASLTPPPLFAAELRRTVRLEQQQQPSEEEAALERRLAAQRAAWQHRTQQAQAVTAHADEVRAAIQASRARPASHGSSAAAAVAALQQEQQAAIEERSRLLQQQAELQAVQLQRRSLAAQGWGAQPPAADAAQHHHQQQQQQREPWQPFLARRKQEIQQQQQPEPEPEPQGVDEDDDVIELLDDKEGGDGRAAGASPDKEDGARADEDADEEASEDAAAAEAAAAALGDLGLSVWIAPRADWAPTPEQLARFEGATGLSGSGPPGQVLASHQRSAIELKRSDLASLAPGEWLNDEVMNMYCALLQDRDSALRAASSSASSSPLRCHYLSTFFLAKLYRDSGTYAFKDVRRWTGPAKLKRAGLTHDCVLKCDRVLVPVHEGNHWTALMVDLQRRRLVFFDSMGGRNRAAVAAVKRWVADEAQDKLGEAWDASAWPEEYPADIPRQRNGCDCGVFALLFLNRLGLAGRGFDFDQRDLLQHARVAIACELLDGRVGGSHAAVVAGSNGAAAGAAGDGEGEE